MQNTKDKYATSVKEYATLRKSQRLPTVDLEISAAQRMWIIFPKVTQLLNVDGIQLVLSMLAPSNTFRFPLTTSCLFHAVSVEAITF